MSQLTNYSFKIIIANKNMSQNKKNLEFNGKKEKIFYKFLSVVTILVK